MEESHEILKFISDVHRREFHEPRQLEWKTVITTVSFYVLATAAKLSGQASLSHSCSVRALVWAIFLGLAVASSSYLYGIHRGNRTNKSFAEAAEAGLIDASKDEQLVRVLKSAGGVAERPSRFDWAFWWEAAVVFAFAIAAAFSGTNLATSQLTG